MSIQRFIISALAIIASCHASGIGHLVSPPSAIQSFPIVRYAPFFNFPNTGRSIHAVAPVAPAHLLPAPAPVFPAPVPAPTFPAQAIAAPAFPAPLFHASAIAPAPVPLPAPAFPAYPAPQPFFAPTLPRLAPLVPTLPRISSLVPSLPRLAPIVPASPPTSLYAHGFPVFQSAPFSPIIRPVAPAVAPVVPAPLFAPAPVVKSLPFGLPAYPPHLPYGHAPFVKQVAWK